MVGMTNGQKVKVEIQLQRKEERGDKNNIEKAKKDK